MSTLTFAVDRLLDLVLLGRVTVDFNPAYSNRVHEEFKPLQDIHYFEKFVGGSLANIAVGVARHGFKAGFIAKVSDDQFGDFAVDYLARAGVDTTHVTRAVHGEKFGLTFTEMASSAESHILMYRDHVADLQLQVDDIDEAYLARAKALLISGTALAQSPSREAALKALFLRSALIRRSFST